MPIDTSPNDVATSALSSIPFGSLIGGPLSAAVEAQANAAKSTSEYILAVGVDSNGQTRQVTFKYVRDGQDVNLIVPLLSIIPIPFLAIETLDINFKAAISASASTYSENTTSEDTSAGGSADLSFGWGPFKGEMKMNASYSSKKDSKATADSKYSVEYTMDVAVHAGSDSMPAGLATVLSILKESISSSPTSGSLASSVSGTLLNKAGSTVTVSIQVKDPSGRMVQTEKDVTVTVPTTWPTAALTVTAVNVGSGTASAGSVVGKTVGGVAKFTVTLVAELTDATSPVLGTPLVLSVGALSQAQGAPATAAGPSISVPVQIGA